MVVAGKQAEIPLLLHSTGTVAKKPAQNCPHVRMGSHVCLSAAVGKKSPEAQLKD